MYLLTSNAESCDDDVEEVGVDDVEELVDKPRTTNDTMLFLTADPVVCVPMVLEELPERKNCWSFFKKHNCHEKRSNSLTYTVASSLVCTSPLAVITVVGHLDVLMVSKTQQS